VSETKTEKTTEQAVPPVASNTAGEEIPTREQLREALSQAAEEIDALKARNASLERALAGAKVLLNVPRKPRKVRRQEIQARIANQTKPPAAAKTKE
jgi:hypothetical protein